MDTAPRRAGFGDWLNRLGMPPALFWGYIAVLIFMIGDGVESNYLAPYLAHHGFTLDSAATIISFYGITVTLGSWLAGALSTLYGPRRVMMLGAAIWMIFEVLFLALAMPAESFELSLVTYGIRGIAYPMFAYAFLVWIQAATPADQRGSATGWFWLVFTGGLPTLGSAVAIGSIPLIGEYATFWLSLGLVALGALIGLVAVRERTGFTSLLDEDTRREQSTARILASGIDILGRRPRVAVAGIVRIINTTPYFGFFIFLPGFFTGQMGFSQSGYLTLITIMGLVGMSFNPIVGRLSDTLGWRKILTFVGGLGSAVSMLLMYFVPQWSGGNYVLSLVFACLYGITLCGYVPAAALIGALCPREDKGNALAIYCLAAGVSTFIGPVLYRLLNAGMGMTGVVWIYAGLYVLSAALSWFFLITPADPGERHRWPSATGNRETDEGAL
ncbi:MFS transporter [Salinisphaera sp. Q1T1-3]|uniref:MFS transporter n=1 Tax=Salinisphaera sp. Q1T1-3 TaxID=2321229 RepID=UPI000E715A74|nr:MFS transporter [Salinisphaera sp. Q1T1-3]RJS93041.1 MFS transporter [Salinisphaera sp. Q1T1-3]